MVEKPDRARCHRPRSSGEFLNFSKSQISYLCNGDSIVSSSLGAGRVKGESIAPQTGSRR